MPNPLTTEECIAVLKAEEEYDTYVQAAQALDLNINTFKHRLKTAKERHPEWRPHKPTVEHIPPAEIPFEEQLEYFKKANAQRLVNKAAGKYRKVHIPVEGPYALCWFGDPHLDDPYCDLASFENHAKICASTPAMFGINGGDTLNNWVGKLERLYADQPVTRKFSWNLANWALNELGVNWLVWILGNHDDWNQGAEIFKRMNTNEVFMEDWGAKITVVSPDKSECRLWARHDFKGSSIYNELHGPKRAAMFDGGEAHIYAAFHRHQYAMGQYELDNGREVSLIRARGYKDWDRHADVNGFPQQTLGQSVVSVIVPGKQPVVNLFNTVEEGADFLKFKRAKMQL